MTQLGGAPASQSGRQRDGSPAPGRNKDERGWEAPDWGRGGAGVCPTPGIGGNGESRACIQNRSLIARAVPTTFSAHTMTLSQLHAASLSHVALVTGLEGYMGYTGSFAAVYRGYMGWQSRKADNAKC